MTLIEAEAWENEQWLHGNQNGKIHAVLDFTVPDQVKSYGLLLVAILEKGCISC